MSTAVVPPNEAVDPPEVVREMAEVDRTVSLQIEYRKKVRRLAARYGVLKQEKRQLEESKEQTIEVLNKRRRLMTDEDRIKKKYRPVVVAAENLARYASGLIENARLPQIDKIELQLRNAELEAELIEARHLIG